MKNWLGIEGVKVELELPDELDLSTQVITGKAIFYSQTAQEVSRLTIKLMERYERGRGEDKKIDEYALGQIELEDSLLIPAEQSISLDFKLPFKAVRSEMDEYASKNIFYRGLVRSAKWANSVKSNYYVLAEANVKGVALDPFVKQAIKAK